MVIFIFNTPIILSLANLLQDVDIVEDLKPLVDRNGPNWLKLHERATNQDKPFSYTNTHFVDVSQLYRKLYNF